MGKKDRKQRKRKERQERLRQEKHQRHFGTPGYFEVDLVPEYDIPSEAAVERQMRFPERSLLGKVRDLLPGAGSADSPRERAQALAYDAMDAETARQAAELARQALALDPDCADALTLLTDLEARSPKARVEGYQQAIAAAERSLGGPAYLEKHRGHFWRILETRPYMRARASLAQALREQGRLPEAIAEYEAMLDLNPHDNQGNRDLLYNLYFLTDNLDRVRWLLERYKDDASCVHGYAHILERFLAGDLAGAAEVRAEARQYHPDVEPYLTGRKKMPRVLPEFFVWGGEGEGVQVMTSLGDAWAKHPEAVAWLRSLPGR